MLFRAIAYTYQLPVDEPEVFVFFEAADHDAARAKLPQLLANAWGTPADRIETYNMSSERELLGESIGAMNTGDARLLESGAEHGRPLYAEPARTQLLCSPRAMQRLIAAQWAVKQLQRPIAVCAV